MLWFRQFRRPQVTIRFGKPFKFRHEGGRLPREHFRAMTDEAMYRIAELLPENLRGVYADLDQATTEFLDFDVSWDSVERQIPRRVVAQIQQPIA
jgi:hypothetical protein